MKPKRNRLIVFFIISLVFMLLFTSPVKAHPTAEAIQQDELNISITKGFEYIASQMNDDGGIRWTDETSSAAATIRVVHALAAAGFSQDTLVSENGNRPIDFLMDNGLKWVNQEGSETPGFSAARAGQLLTAIAAANQNPHSFGSPPTNLIYKLNLDYDLNTFLYGSAAPDNVTDQVWAIIGLVANNAFVPVDSVDWLMSVQGEDGSWNDGYGSYLDTTPLAVLALVGSNYYSFNSESIQNAIAFMADNQQPDGGWQPDWDIGTNVNTTGVMLQALSALGQSATHEAWQQPDGNPKTALLAIQKENGVFGGEFANAFSTADAIIGLTGHNITTLGFLQKASKAFDFLLSVQDENGGWGSVGQTIDVMLALRAAGWMPETVTYGASNPLDYISANLYSYLEAGPDAIGKAIVGITAAGFDPTDFNDTDLVQNLISTYDDSTQTFGSPDNTWHQAFGILGLYAAEMDIPQGAVNTLVSLQQDDGGWEYTSGYGTSPDNTSIAVQALLAAGLSKNDPVITRALEYIKIRQMDDTGWNDSSTTSFTMMALNLLDEPAENWVTGSGKLPLAYLFSFQKPNGAFVYSWDYPDDNIMSTASSLLALFGEDYLTQSTENVSEHYAAIVIDSGDDETQTACVPFSGESISGIELLEGSGFSHEYEDGLINSIVHISNPEGETNYWSYWFWDGRDWIFQSTGAGDSVVLPGTVEAWHYTSWESFPSLPTEFIPDINDLCEELNDDLAVNFTQQPHLNWNNLFPLPLQLSDNFTPDTIEPIAEATQEPAEVSTDETPAETPGKIKEEPALNTKPEETEQISITESSQEASVPIRSPLPLFIIGVIAIFLLATLGFVFLKKFK